MVLGLRKLLSSRLLGLEAPDIGTRLELGNVLGVLVALVASSSWLGGLGREGSLVGRLLASLEQHLLLVQRVGHHGRLAGEVEILAHGLLGRRAVAEGVIVEVIVGVIELVAETVVRLFEIDARDVVRAVLGQGPGGTYASSSVAPPPSAAKAS